MSQVFNTPLLMEAGSLNVFLSALTDRVGIDQLTGVDNIALMREDMRALAGNAQGRQMRNYQVDDGVAIIPVTGTLSARSSQIQSLSGMTSYDSLTGDLWQALDDPLVDSILLDISSPGGQVDELFALTDFIAEIGEVKPISAYTGSMAASGAYAIAAAADTLYVSESANTGSVGVIIAHTDVSKKMADDGVKVTLIHAGAHKVDGNPYEPLSTDVKADLQKRVDKTRDLFVNRVAKYRNMSPKAVAATEAAVFDGADAVSVGFADQVATFEETLSIMKKKQTENTGQTMSATVDAPEAVAEVTETETEAVTGNIDLEVTDTVTGEVVYATNHIHTPEAMGAVEIIEACQAVDLSDLATGMIAGHFTLTQVNDRLTVAGQLSELCEAAGMEAGGVLAAIGDPVAMFRAVLAQASEAEINSMHVGAEVADEHKTLSTAEIWRLRQEQTAH